MVGGREGNGAEFAICSKENIMVDMAKKGLMKNKIQKCQNLKLTYQSCANLLSDTPPFRAHSENGEILI